MTKQCEAVTLASTYSAAHRCLKPKVGAKRGGRYLCRVHKDRADRKPS